MTKKPESGKKFNGKRKDKPYGITEKVINILKILNSIESGEAPSVNKLAELCEVSERTIYRYLSILQQIVPIHYDRKKKGYRLVNDRALRVIPFETKEIVLLECLKDFLGSVSTDLRDIFKGLISKIYACTKETPSVCEILHFIFPDAVDIGHFNSILDAIVNRRKLRIEYKSLSSGKLTVREVDPYGLVFHDGLWYLYGFCYLRNDFRIFALDRIVNFEVLYRSFERRSEIELREAFKDSWRLWRGDRKRVVIRFFPQVAELIKRRRWHPSESKKELEDGSLELTLEVAGLEEIKWWIYSWIPYCEVVAPQELREEIKRELKETLNLYERDF